MDAEPAAQPPLQMLLVEDDADIARLISLHLEELHAEVSHVPRGDEALQCCREQTWDILLLDLRLPGLGGLDICRQLRASGDQTPILMLTSKSSELDRVLGLELGADDYVTKPFSPIELVARIKAILRRARQSGPAEADTQRVLHCGNLTIDVREHRVTHRDVEVDLTAREFDLLLHFARHPGQVFRRSELLDEVWGYGHEGYEHTVNSHINRLRAKIEDNPTTPSAILTVWGVGYKFNDCASANP